MFEMSQSDWDGLYGQFKAIVGEAGAQPYADSKMGRLVAAIAYISGSEDPDRYALANLLLLYGAAHGGKAFDHRPSDDHDPFRRLAAFRVGERAYERAVDYGLKLLAYVMLMDYEADMAQDASSGKYNPLNSGAWNAKELKEEILAELDEDGEMKALYAPYMTADSVKSPWWSA